VGRVAIWRIDPLGGLSREIVARLESLLTQEMGRIAGDIVPSVKTQQVQRHSRSLRRCEGADRCLAAIGRRLHARLIVSGTLASLGSHYVVTLKAVSTRTGRSVRRISEPLQGEKEQLIEAVRVAAYRLLRPEALRGAIQLIVNMPGAVIYVDGRRIGVSPLRSAISGLSVGDHHLRITHPDFADFIRTVKVRFQKTRLVRVRLIQPRIAPARPGPSSPGPPVVRDHPTPFYARWWFWTIVSAVAIGAGVGVGLAVPRRRYVPVNCDGGGCQ